MSTVDQSSTSSKSNVSNTKVFNAPPELKEREWWWIKVPGEHELKKLLINSITDRTVGLSILRATLSGDGLNEWPFGTYKKSDLEFVEKVEKD